MVTVDPLNEPDEAPLNDDDAEGSRKTPPRWRVAVSGQGLASGGMGGQPQAGVALYAELLRQAAGSNSPSVRAGFVWIPPQDHVADRTNFGQDIPGSYSSQTGRVTGRLDGCPLGFIASQPWARDALSAQACARFDFGDFEASGGTDGTDAHRRWVDLGTFARLRWLFPTWFLETEGGLLFPLTRYRLVDLDVEQGVQGARVPATLGTFALGVGALFR
jgi:hypothetical protein